MSWSLVSFSDVVGDFTGGNPKVKSEDYLETGSLPVIDQGKIHIGGYINDETLACSVNLPVVIFGDHTKELKFLDQRFAMGADGIKVLKPNDDRLDEKYLYYFLKQAKLPNDAGYSRHFKFLKRLKIPLPPLEEQKRIAGILDQADALQRKREKAIGLTDSLLRAVFLDMFGDPVTNPMGWETCKLETICSKITDGTHQSPKWSETGVPFLFISNIQDFKINFQTKKFISDDEFKKLTKNSPVEMGDVLYTTVGSYGNAALVDSNTKFCFQRHIAHIKPNDEIIDPFFLWIMMNSDGVRRQANSQVRGVAQKTLNLKQLKDFVVFSPPKQIQKTFNLKAIAIKNLGEKLFDLGGLNNDLLASLTQRAFRGEL